jgi:hypothetical protein
MSSIFNELESSLPTDCKEALDNGTAELVFKGTNFAIVDKEEVALFKCLPLIITKFGFCIAIPYGGKVSYTCFSEIACRTRGITKFKNGFKCDYRTDNLEITPWAEINTSNQNTDANNRARNRRNRY